MTIRHRILVTDPLHPAGLERLRERPDFELIERVGVDAEALAPDLEHISGWLIRSGTKVRAEDLERAPRLQVVARAGVGVDNVDVAACTRRGVLVMNAPDANSVTTAELTIAHLLSMSRHLVRGDAMVRSGSWERKKLVGTEIEDKVLAVVGMGRIGRHVARKALGLGMRVIGHDPYLTQEALSGLNAELMSLNDALERADYLTLHMPLTDATRGMLGADALARVKPGLRIVNCARGGLVDEAALLAAIEDGRVAAAALDVFSAEPPSPDHPLLARPEVVATPHLGASTEEASRKVSIAVADQVANYLLEQRIAHAVNLPPLAPDLLAQLQPSLELARLAGSFLAQIIDWPVSSVRAEYRGEVTDTDVQPLTLSFMQGFLGATLDAPVNLVNARLLAAERGIEISEVKASNPRDFSSMLMFTADTVNGTRSIGATLFGRRMPRFVLLDGARTEIVPDGHLLVLRNRDEPGVVGRIGTMLGEAGVNIGNMHVSAANAAASCWAVLGLSCELDATLMAAIQAMPGIVDARQVTLQTGFPQ